MRNKIESITKVLIYASFLVPLVVLPTSFIFPFVVPKVLLFRSLVSFMFAGYVLLMLINPSEYLPKFTPLSIALLAFLGSFFISTIVGVDAYHSFWDNHERMLGLFTIFHYVAYYFVCTALFKNWTEWKWALRLFLFAGSIVMGVGLIQHFSPDFLLNQGGSRVIATLGNAIYVGGYGLFLSFVGLLLVLREKDTVWRWVEGLLGFLGFIGIILSGTRGSLLGFMTGLLMVAVGYVIVLKDKPALRKGIGGVLVGGLVVLGILYAFRTTPAVQRIPLLGYLLNSSLSAGTGETRKIAWEIAFQSWKQYPIFGWGPNNFFYAFNQYYNPRSLEFGPTETWFDNAHNILLNTLTVQGIVGLATYLAIFGVAWWTLWSKRSRNQLNPHLIVICSGFLLAHLVQNVTVFEDATSYLYFMFWLALVNHLGSAAYAVPAEDQPAVKAPSKFGKSITTDKAVGWGWVLASIVAAGFIVFVFDLQPARANMKTLDAMSALSSGEADSITAAKDAVQFSSPHIDDIRNDIVRTVIELLGQTVGQGTMSPAVKEAVLEYVNFGRSELEKNVAIHPLDIRVYMSIAQLDQLAFATTQQGDYLYDADRNLDTALQYSPHRQQLIYMSSAIKVQLGEKDAVVKMLQQCINDDPKIAESYWRLAYAYYIFKDFSQAQQVLTEAQARGIVFDSQGQQVVNLVMGGASSTPHTP